MVQEEDAGKGGDAGRGDSKARKCPICGKPATPRHRPFRSARCADVDLHRWLGGVYAIPAEDSDEAPPLAGEPRK